MCFNENTNTFGDVTTDEFEMRRPFEGNIYDNPQKFSFLDFIDFAVINYLSQTVTCVFDTSQNILKHIIMIMELLQSCFSKGIIAVLHKAIDMLS